MARTLLIIAGAVLEFIGLVTLLVEVAFIRNEEFGVPPLWMRVRGIVNQFLAALLAQLLGGLLGRLFGGMHHEIRVPGARAGGGYPVRAEQLPQGASDVERIDRLERHVEHLVAALDELRGTIDERTDQAIEEAARLDDKVRDEIEQRENARRERLRRSLARQRLSAVCLLLGLALGTAGHLS